MEWFFSYMLEAHMRRNAVILELDGRPVTTMEEVGEFFMHHARFLSY